MQCTMKGIKPCLKVMYALAVLYPFAWGNSSSASSLEIPEPIRRSVCLLNSPAGTGTATILSKNGLVATNAHVISYPDLKIPKSQNIYLKCDDKKLRIKEVLYLNHQEDLALLRLKNKSQHYISLSKKSPQVGDTVSIIGFPSDGKKGFHKSALTNGVIDSINNDELGPFGNKRTVMRTNATIGPGSSGSPVLLNGFFSGIVYAGRKEKKSDFHGKSFAVGSDIVRRAIEYTRRYPSKKARELPSAKACDKKKTKGCLKRAQHFWNLGHPYKSLSILDSKCKKGLPSNCSYAKKMLATIKGVKDFYKGIPLLQIDSEKDEFFEYSPPTVEGGESHSLLEKLQQSSIIIVGALTIFILLLILTSLFIGNSRIHQLKKERNRKINDYFKIGKRLESIFYQELVQSPLRGLINKAREIICKRSKNIENLKEDFEKEMIAREKNDSMARRKFHIMYIKSKRVGYKIFGWILLLAEGSSVFTFLYLNLRKQYPEWEAYFYSGLMAMFIVVIVHLIIKIQYKFWHHVFKLYLIFLIPSGITLMWKIVEGRTDSIENLLHDPIFSLATLLTATFGAFVLQFYPGTPQEQHECTFLVENLDKQKQEINSITTKKIKDFLIDMEQDQRSVKDIVIEGTRCLGARLMYSKHDRENYIKKIERVSSSTSLPPTTEPSTVKIVASQRSDSNSKCTH